MPGRDGTGPMGMGPMTGRRAGYRGGRDAAQGAGRGLGSGRGRGAGRGGPGRRNTFYATGLTGWQRAATAAETTPPTAGEPATPVEKETLETEIEAMQSHLDAMKKRFSEIEPQRQ